MATQEFLPVCVGLVSALMPHALSCIGPMTMLTTHATCAGVGGLAIAGIPWQPPGLSEQEVASCSRSRAEGRDSRVEQSL